MEIENLIDSLNPHERKLLPHLECLDVIELSKRSNLEKISVLRALDFLENKKIIEIFQETKKVIDLGLNGINYKRKGLPERRLLELVFNERIISINDAQEKSKLSPDEFKASLGALKKKALIELSSGNIKINAKPEEVTKKSLEEQLIEVLPCDYEKLAPEQLFALDSLQKRKDIILINELKEVKFTITDLGKEIIKKGINEEELIESITPQLLKSEKNWKAKKFRRYDVESPVPMINGGKKHFVNQSLEYIRKIWTDLGFTEIQGDSIQQSFWNFDALFQPQDHPAREMADTFFIDKKQELPSDVKLIEAVKKSHETGIEKSKGWGYKWNEDVAKQMVFRTHTTSLSSQFLYQNKEKELPLKIFAIGKCFRNETIDWCHGFEFYQTEGVVVDENVNFRHLLGYLKQFYKKMGFDSIRFRPAYFPYTEPSVEVDVWHPEKKVWLELGGAGMFRPEISITLLGKYAPILAWGQGIDRIIMDYYKIKDLRELYKNNFKQLREIKIWNK
jgi:phenylalanyl-tRNA synthetase alpha chain